MPFSKNLTFSSVLSLSQLQYRDISHLVRIADRRLIAGMRVGLDETDQMVTVEYDNGTKLTRTRNAGGMLTVIVLKQGNYWMNSGGTFWAPID